VTGREKKKTGRKEGRGKDESSESIKSHLSSGEIDQTKTGGGSSYDHDASSTKKTKKEEKEASELKFFKK